MGKIKHHHFITASAAALALGISAAATAPAYGSETASATIALASSQVVSGQTQYTYQLSLTNTSTDGSTVGTFWFAWIPGQSYMADNPIITSAPPSPASPTNWHVGLVVKVGVDVIPGLDEKGSSIQWVAGPGSSFDSTDALAAGQTLSGFSFTTPDSPSSVFGDSVYFPGTPVLTSQVYHAAPFSDTFNGINGYQFITQVVPEPATFGLMAMGSAGLLLLGRKRKSA
ncbi:MAG: PEP-CTERM sorting domain-containing protein [Phycisphaerae bacterium]